MEELKRVKDQVMYLLAKYPATRDNDFYLVLMWLKLFGGLKEKLPYLEWPEIERIGGTVESVTRARRKIQNEMGLYQPTIPTKKGRKEKEEIIRGHIHEL